MALSQKYNRTYHYPFSLGASSDDRIHLNYWEDIQQITQIIHTEKLDGENNCLSKYGVFARSHASPTVSPWTQSLRQRWELIKHDLGDLEIFGENLYAIHSIEYQNLEDTFFIFAIRYLDCWLSWDEVQCYATLLDFPTVPVIKQGLVKEYTAISLEKEVISLSQTSSVFGSIEHSTGTTCSKEGIVTRNSQEFLTSNFKQNVFKFVRKGHVTTNEHWTKNWKKAHVAIHGK